ncbi:MAG: GHMP kinase [Acidisphaera sp.]|nr:GHMP kinase [Acidisphaera sp.]
MEIIALEEFREARRGSRLPGPVIVRARAPLRLGLCGGGTDLPAYAERFGGAVLNATIDRYAFAFIRPRSDGLVAFRARDLGVEETHPARPAITGSRLALHHGVYDRMVRQFNGGAPLPITVTTSVDAPMGSGLGSSSALVVALIEAYRTYLNLPLGRYDVAHLAYEIERLDLALAGGKQDHYAAAFGGVNYIEFMAGDRVIVNPLRFADGTLNELETSLVICFSGQSRASDAIIGEQNARLAARDPATLTAMHQLKDDAADMKAAMLAGRITEVAAVLNRSWLAKKRTAAGVSSGAIEAAVACGMANGALASKVSGAGGGGFVMFIVPPEERFVLISALQGAGAAAHPVKLSDKGSETWVLTETG